MLSSWILRIAEGHGFSLSAFRQLELPRVSGAGFDLDLISDPYFFHVLATKSGGSVPRAIASTYVSDEGLVFTQQIKGNFEWIIPPTQVSQKSGKRFASLPFCSACLSSDEVPYYRKHWRYAFYPCCPKHGLLSNQCPTCHQPFSYLESKDSTKHGQQVGGLKHCVYCAQHFLSSTLEVPDRLIDSVLEIERFIEHAIHHKSVIVGKNIPVHTAMFLRGLREIITLITRPQIGEKVAHWVAAELNQLTFPGYNILGEGSFESRPAISRAWLLILAYWLIEDWPHRFVSMVKQSGLTASNFLPPSKQRPSWMTVFDIEQLFYRPLARSPEETDSARRLLGRIRNFAPTREETAAFMESGAVPPIKALALPTSPLARQAMNEEFDQRRRQQETDKLVGKKKLSRTKTLYPAIKSRYRDNDTFGSFDVVKTSLPGLVEKLRRDQSE